MILVLVEVKLTDHPGRLPLLIPREQRDVKHRRITGHASDDPSAGTEESPSWVDSVVVGSVMEELSVSERSPRVDFGDGPKPFLDPKYR